jgi:drug/metabolite transporter (DMT)-like permease
VAFVVVCVTFLTYLFNILAIQKLSPTHAGVYIYLQPPIAAIFSVWACFPVADLFSIPKITFTAMIILGVIAVSRNAE